MIEIQNTDSLFYLSQNEHEAVVVTTNGVIRKNGDAVLGKGQALEAKKLVPGLEHQLGEYLRRYGNRAFYWHLPYQPIWVSIGWGIALHLW